MTSRIQRLRQRYGDLPEPELLAPPPRTEGIADARTIYRKAQIRPTDDVDTIEEKLLTAWKGHLFREGLRSVFTDITVSPYINHGRWVADCPNCRGGMGVTESFDTACCLDCGHFYHVQFPGGAAEAEALLSARPAVNRNWHPATERVADLKAENKAHGLGRDN